MPTVAAVYYRRYSRRSAAAEIAMVKAWRHTCIDT